MSHSVDDYMLLQTSRVLRLPGLDTGHSWQVSLSQAKGYQGHAVVRRAVGSAVGSGLQRPLRAATAGRSAGGSFKPRGSPAVTNGARPARRGVRPKPGMLRAWAAALCMHNTVLAAAVELLPINSVQYCKP